jgi:gentisate 1,2-dioxygenase
MSALTAAPLASAPRQLTADIPTLDTLYEACGGYNFTPGWVPRKKPIMWGDPRPEFVPAHWRYEDAKAGLDAAGRLIDVSLAERRNLVMRNPAPGTNFETTLTLVCAYQAILPGETAPSHRHSSHALRVTVTRNDMITFGKSNP